MGTLLSPPTLPGDLRDAVVTANVALPQIVVETMIGYQAEFKVTN